MGLLLYCHWFHQVRLNNSVFSFYYYALMFLSFFFFPVSYSNCSALKLCLVPVPLNVVQYQNPSMAAALEMISRLEPLWGLSVFLATHCKTRKTLNVRPWLELWHNGTPQCPRVLVGSQDLIYFVCIGLWIITIWTIPHICIRFFGRSI